MLPPILEGYRRKLADAGRDKKRRGGTQVLMERLFQAMYRRFLWRLQSMSVNPEFFDSIATGRLSRSLRRRVKTNPSQYRMDIYTSAAHYEFVDSGESDAATEPSRQRIKQWIEARFGLPASTQDGAIIDNPQGGGEIRYGSLVTAITQLVRQRLATNYYQGINLTDVIGQATTKPGGQEALYDLMDFWLSFYTIGAA